MVPTITGMATIVRIMVATWEGTTPAGSTEATTGDLTAVAGIINSGFVCAHACE